MAAVNYAVHHASFCKLLSHGFHMGITWNSGYVVALFTYANIHIPEWGSLGMRLAMACLASMSKLTVECHISICITFNTNSCLIFKLAVIHFTFSAMAVPPINAVSIVMYKQSVGCLRICAKLI